MSKVGTAPAPAVAASPAPAPTPTTDRDRDTRIIQVDNTVSLTRTAKVVNPPKFSGEPAKLKEFIAKLQIYVSHNDDSFDSEASKVLFAISYLEGAAFDFIEVYLDDYNKNPNFKEMSIDTRQLFRSINKFVRIMKTVYREPYEEEKAT